jgi:hypothetical protein
MPWKATSKLRKARATDARMTGADTIGRTPGRIGGPWSAAPAAIGVLRSATDP